MSQVDFSIISEGSASRFIRKSWLTNEPAITPAAFSLRGKGESFVSFYLVTGNCFQSKINSAIEILGNGPLDIREGAITILEVEECLNSVNDPDEDIVIEFKDASKRSGDTHCGLYYLTENEVAIFNAKTILCYLAKQRLHEIKNQKLKIK